jgi:hypothetical protein
MKTRTWIALAGLCLLAALAGDGSWFAAGALEAQAGKDEKIVVRKLKFVPKDPTVTFRIGGKSKLTTLEDATAVEKLVGKDSAKALVDLVDFKKEKIVFVSWTTGGPPDGVLSHEVKGTGKELKLNFYVQGPPAGNPRGLRARLGADFFVVPRSVAVAFDPKER